MTEIRDKRINEIIEAAINEFIEKGYENASMESIAKRANLSKGGLYHYFKSKAEVLFMVNMKFIEPIQDFMIQIDTNKSIVKGLNRFITDYLSYWNNHKRELTLYFLIMNVAFEDQQIMKLYKESARQNFDYFEALFLKGQQLGVFRESDAHARAVALLSCLDGYIGYLLIDSSLQLDRIEKEIQNIFIKDLLK